MYVSMSAFYEFYLFYFFIFDDQRYIILKLTQLTTGGNNEADIATPINGPLLPCSKAIATPVPDGSAQRTPIHSDL